VPPDENLDLAEYQIIIDAIYRIVGGVEGRLDGLREADREAVRLAHDELLRRLEGFPGQFAMRTEAEEAARALQRLERDSLSREVYDQNHRTLADAVTKLENDKLPESVFNTFADNLRLDQERRAALRREVTDGLAHAIEQVRTEFHEMRSEFLSQESYDLQHRELANKVNAVERWEYKLVGGLVFATFVAPLVTAIVVWAITRK
jgi:hypothetical protein